MLTKKKSTKILVTGSEGFIAKDLISKLKKDNYIVYTLDLKKNKSKYHFSLDLSDYEKIIKTITIKFDTIIHLASQSDIEKSLKDPSETIFNNIIGTLNILKLREKKNIKNLIFASTIYVNSDQGSFYRVSKQTCEDLIIEFNKRNKFNFSIIRYGSVYGKFAPFSNRINKVIEGFRNNKKQMIDGKGDEIRKYIHVSDVASLTIKIMELKKTKFKFYEITGKKPYKFSKLISQLEDKTKINPIHYNNIISEGHYIKNPYNKTIYPIMKLSPKNDNTVNKILELINNK
tara:strand:- start:331 stop:1194 length:864 start_codon:yes stop_codon:yes gene_type:complete